MTSPTFTKLSAWSGLIFITLLGLAWIFFLRILPFPHAPTDSVQDIALLFQEHRLSMGLGAVLMMYSCFFASLFGSLMVKLMMKLEDGLSLFSINLIMAFAVFIVIGFITALFWGLAALRADEITAETIRLLNDIAWLNFFSTAPPFMVMYVAIAWGALAPANQGKDIFPKWYGYLNLWTLIAVIPGPICLLVKTGPFAWNGLIVFWFAAIVFSFNYLISPKVLAPAAKKHLLND